MPKSFSWKIVIILIFLLYMTMYFFSIGDMVLVYNLGKPLLSITLALGLLYHAIVPDIYMELVYGIVTNQFSVFFTRFVILFIIGFLVGYKRRRIALKEASVVCLFFILLKLISTKLIAYRIILLAFTKPALFSQHTWSFLALFFLNFDAIALVIGTYVARIYTKRILN